MTLASTSLSDSAVVLAVDTATSLPGLAVMRGDRLLAELHLRGPLGRVEHLLPEVQGLLDRLGLSLKEISALAVAVGPGSFTGVRVGLATVQGLAMVTGALCVGVSTLEAHAALQPYARVPVTALVDPRRGVVYAGTYSTEAGWPSIRVPDAHVSFEKVVADATRPTLFVGDGVEALRPQLELALGEGALFSPAGLGEGVARAVAAAGVRALLSGLAVPASQLSPLYLQASAAETNARLASSS